MRDRRSGFRVDRSVDICDGDCRCDARVQGGAWSVLGPLELEKVIWA